MRHLLVTSLLLLLVKNISSLNGVWRWECKDDNYCEKTRITPDTEPTALSLPACRLLCSKDSLLWPKPTGTLSIGPSLVKFSSIRPGALPPMYRTSNSISREIEHLREHLQKSLPRQTKAIAGGKTIVLYTSVADASVEQLTLETDESYTLTISERPDGDLNVTLVAETIFGLRHGSTTLTQLSIYDDLRDELQIPNDVLITDKPAYPYRGILLDTSRNYISMAAIKRTLDAMRASKLNRFHWHLTDTHSFPLVLPSLPDLSQFGAYSAQKIYSPDDVTEIIRYGLERGISVIPEFDAPAHVGEGWQTTDFVVCFNAKPWVDYCVEPPCGQFDPTKSQLYDTLEVLYGDMLRAFQPDIFHMGGDEVHFGCWNTTDTIVEWMRTEKNWGRTEEDFVKLWDLFQNESLTRLHNQAGYEIPVIMWTSTLTEEKYLRYLPKEKYIIQIWTTESDPQVATLLDNGYRVILSNYDSLYLDCGFGAWVTDGNNWCSPYIGWQKVYENRPGRIAGDRKNLVLGSEAILWTEQVDSGNVDSRLWPRAAAMAEVLWSEPEGSWRDAEQRMLIHRERLVELGVDADALQPEWCAHYETHCPIRESENPVPGKGAASTKALAIVLMLISIIIIITI